MRKSIYILFLSIFLVVAIMMTACKKPTVPQNSGSNDSTSLDQQVSTSKSDDSSQQKPTPAPHGDVQGKLDAFSKLCDLDEDYCAVDLNQGFSETVKRADNSFEDYPIGYGQDTTGGRGATLENTYSVQTGLEFEQAVLAIQQKVKTDSATKSIIIVTGTITEDNSSSYQIVLNNVKNLSIIGSGGELDGVGLNFKSSENIIVQNLKIHHPSKKLRNEKDCIEFNTCKYVWVDHCEFFNDYPQNSAEKDYYDGLIDLKNESEFVTISYNYLHDAFKTSLVGSGPSDLYKDRTVTYHHNIFENCNSRMPLFRSGYAHIYNNYYKNILSRGVDTRFGAKVYVENNVFENAKNMVGNFEESEGYYNLKGNVTINCRSTLPSTNTTDYTPSYRYTLDETDSLVTYLNLTVGLNKIDIEKAKAMPQNMPNEYKIAEWKIVKKAISELKEASLEDDYQQKMTFISQEYNALSESDKTKIDNINIFNQKAEDFLNLYEDSLESEIAKIDTNGDFVINSKLCYQTVMAYDKMSALINGRVENYSALTEKENYFNTRFKDLFNLKVTSLIDAKATDRSIIDDLYYLYELKKDVQGLDKEGLDKANTVCDDKIKIEAFSKNLQQFDGVGELLAEHSPKIVALIETYDALSAVQKSYISSTDLAKYEDILTKYNALKDKTLKMDLTNIAVGRVTSVTAVGDVRLGVSTDIREASETFDGVSYNKTVFLSGYGNPGSKCLQLSVLKNSTIELVVKIETDACNLLLTDENKVVKQSSLVSEANVVKITFTDISQGEYRIFTDIPSSGEEATFKGSKVFIYSVNIIPQQ